MARRLYDIASDTFRSLISRVNDLWNAIFATPTKTSFSTSDYFLIKDSQDNNDYKQIRGSIIDARYYTQTDLDGGQLDNRYYTEAESDAKYYLWQDSGTALSPVNLDRSLVLGNASTFDYDPSTGKLKLFSVAGSNKDSLTIKANPLITSNAAFSVKELPLSVDLETGKAFQFQCTGEIKARGMFYSDGSYGIGDGTNIRDTFISRSGASELMISSDKNTPDVCDLLVKGGVTIEQGTDQNLISWTQGKDYEPLVITRNGEGRVTSMTVKWTDGSAGVYTATNYNATHEVYDGYTITHTDTSRTVTQAAVTRNGEGAITNKPALSVA